MHGQTSIKNLRKALCPPKPSISRHGADHSPVSSAALRNEWCYTSIPPIHLHMCRGSSLLHVPLCHQYTCAPSLPSVLRVTLTVKTQAWITMWHILPEVQVILCNCWWQYHLQQDGAVTPSAEWAKYHCQVSSCRHQLCLHNNSLFWSMFYCNMFWLLRTVIFSYFVYNYKDSTPAYNH